MTSQLVRSSRIEKGSYLTDSAKPALIKSFSDERLKYLDSEIERLKLEVERVRSELEAEVLVKAEAARLEGLEEGRELGRSESKYVVEEATSQLQNLFTEIESGLDQVWRQIREGVVRLSLRISRSVIGKIAEDYDSLATDLAKRCLQMVRDQAKVTIAVNPQDADMLRAAEVELKQVAEGVKNIEIVERASIERGGVVIETDAGMLDARLEEQFAMIEATLLPGWSPPSSNDEETKENN